MNDVKFYNKVENDRTRIVVELYMRPFGAIRANGMKL